MDEPSRKPEEAVSIKDGQDEMNLAELPFASLRGRGDSRKAIIYAGWMTDKQGTRIRYRWTVQGGSLAGLPTEFDERVYVALMKVTKDQGFTRRKVPFSVYQLLKIMGLGDSKRAYQDIEDSLDRLMGVTFKSEEAFWDNRNKERVTTSEAFHLIDRYWLGYKEKNQKIREEEGVPAYVIWGETVWNSFKANHIKSLDLSYFYSLESPIARRLYRLLDKRLRDKTEYEFDIFDLAGKLGMVRYPKPVKIRQTLQPALDELIARGFLLRAEVVKVGGYTRIRLTHQSAGWPGRHPRPRPAGRSPADATAYGGGGQVVGRLHLK